MRGLRFAPVVGLVALAILGCEMESDGASDLSMWTVASEPSVSIGGADERIDYIVYGVKGASRLTDGRIVVALQSSSQVKFFSPDGTHHRTVGGEGGGPGEFVAVFVMYRLAGDTLLVISRVPGLTWLSPEGEYVRSISTRIWANGVFPCRIGQSIWYPLSDGILASIFEDNFGIGGCPPLPDSPHRQSALIVREDFAAGTFDTIAILQGTERNSIYQRVFGRSTVLASGGDRVYASDTGSDTILVLSLQGDTIDVLTTPFEAVNVSDRAKKEASRPAVMRGDRVMIPPVPYDYPDQYPRIGRLVVDALDYLWVMRYPATEEPINSSTLASLNAFWVEDGGALWRVLSPEGDLVAEIRTPDGLYPLEIGEDYILGISKDEYDVETVLMYSLDRS